MSEVNLSITEIDENVNINTSQVVDQVSIDVIELGDSVSLVVDELTENVNIEVVENSNQIALSAIEEITSVNVSIDEIEEVTNLIINEGPEGPEGKIQETFETISKNIKAYPFIINYTDSNPTSIVYDLGDSLAITKTFTYTGELITSITLSGDIDNNNINLTKVLTYNQGTLVSVSYN